MARRDDLLVGGSGYVAGWEWGIGEVMAGRGVSPVAPPHPGEIARLRGETRQAENELASIERQRQRRALTRRIDALEELRAWWEPGAMRLERAESSRLHAVAGQIKAERRFLTSGVTGGERGRGAEDWSEVVGQAVSFVMRHDWAAAFAGAREFDATAPFVLPYEVCCFEFRIAGRAVLAFAMHTGGPGSEVVMKPVLETRVGWFEVDYTYRFGPGGWQPIHAQSSPRDALGPLPGSLGGQIQAACVALDARVAVEEPVRQPAALVAARRREGKEPPRDYRVVALARRSRPLAPAPGGGEPGRRRRLHFRRGHWRHYAAGWRIWVRWTLVGDPDLGFIDKHYAL